MYEWFSEFHLQNGYLIRPLVVGTLVSLVCSVIGCFIVLRRMSFLSDAIAHSMLAGVVVGYLTMKILFGQEQPIAAMLIGAIAAGVITVAMIGFVTRVSRIKQDTAIGVMYTGIFALGAFIISLSFVSKYVQIDIYHFIVGSVVSVGVPELWLAAIVASLVLAIVILFYRQFQITSFDPVLAASLGIPVMFFNYLLTACTSLVVVSGVRIAGVILVVALIITPAASAYLLFDRLSRMIAASAVIGVGSYWLGFGLSVLCGSSAGSSIVITSTTIFMLTLVFAPRYGLLADWFRKRSAIPQEIKEDVLGAILRGKGEWVAVREIESNVASKNMRVRRAINLLERADFVNVETDKVMLTEEGHREARRLLRAHRIWETYLQHMGTPDEQLHDRAHKLEHLNDEETIDYLDDKLGHPILDPHGSEIPEDFVHIEGEGAFKASLLREGRTAIVKSIGATKQPVRLNTGDQIVAGPRTAEGTIWNFVLPDGSKLSLDHEDADAIQVDVVEQ